MHNYTSSSSWMVVAGAITLIGATYLVPRHQPTTLRPFTTEQAAARPLSSESVQARLWQDPIEVGWKRIGVPLSGKKKNQESKKEKLWKDWQMASQILQSQIDEEDSESVFYLPIVLSGKPYPESRERRLRYRIALQEAMETMKYRPLNYDNLFYFPVPLVAKGRDGENLKLDNLIELDQCPQLLKQDDFIPVTYEIFEYIGEKENQTTRQVVVFWIDSSIINREGIPNYRNLEVLIKHVAKSMRKGEILSLSGSDELLKLIQNGDENFLPENKEMRVNYAVSTAPRSQFPEFKSESDERIASQIVRTVPSDNYVLAAIVDELQRRIPEFGKRKDKKDEVWLLSEQDTFYSQVMKDEFEKITRKRKLDGVNVKSIGFLKGIDGNLPDDSENAKTESAKSINNLTDLIQTLNQSGVSEQRLFDRRQIDYLQRLAEKLLQEERQKPFHQRVKAIGILGGDVYDKLLIMEVFRHYFPATNYFTTDLDSAYLYGPNAKAARNLIIGSAFGLSPLSLKDVFGDAIINEGQVVFRDSYQTALYHSILKLLWPENEQEEFEDAFKKSFSIGLFEVGRSRFHPLKIGTESISDKRYSWHYPASLDDDPTAATIHEGKSDYNYNMLLRAPFTTIFSDNEKPISMMVSFGRFSLLGMVFISTAFILAIVWGFIRYIKGHELLPEELGASSTHFIWNIVAKALQKKFKRVSSFPSSLLFFAWGLVVFGMIIFATLLMIAPGHVNEYFGDLEPMYWMEGISAWPSILLRLAIFLIGVVMLASSLGRSEVSVKKLKNTLGNRKVLKAHLDTKLNDAESRFTRDLLVIFILTILQMVIMFVIMKITSGHSDGFFTPGRGHWVFLGHEISIALSLSTLLLLVWWAAFRHYRSRTFLIGLNKELHKRRIAVGSNAISSEKEGASLSAAEISALEDYAGISSVTLLPPFAMMVLLVVSRHTIFDGWNIPLVLIVFLSFMLFILLVSAFQLSSAARHLKLAELNYHKISAEPDMKKRKAAEMASVWQDAAGPFGKYQQQPIIQALLFAAAGFGISFIEPTFRFFGM